MATEKLKTDIRQHQIAQAALDIIGDQGLHQLSIKAVSEHVGLVSSAIYRHFKNKDKLIEAVVAMIHSRLLANVEAVCRKESNAISRLHTLLFRHVDLVVKNKGIPLAIFSQDFFAGRHCPRAQVYKGCKAYLDAVEDIIRHGQIDGQIAPDIDAAAASVMFLGLIQPPVILRHMSGGRFDIKKQAKKAWPLFVKALTV